MYFAPEDYLNLKDNNNMPDSSSWTFEAWVTPIADVSITTEQQIFFFKRQSASNPTFEAFLGTNCKCVTVRINSNTGSAASSPSVATLDIPMFLGISVSQSGSSTEVIVDFGGQVGTGTVSSETVGTSSGHLTIGGGFDGYISSVKLYTAGRTAAEMAAEHKSSGCNSMCGSYCAQDGTCPGVCPAS